MCILWNILHAAQYLHGVIAVIADVLAFIWRICNHQGDVDSLRIYQERTNVMLFSMIPMGLSVGMLLCS